MKNSIVSGLIFSTFLWYGLGGCTKQSEDKLSKRPGAGDCDTTSVKYATDIVPILQSNCYECHGNGSSTGSGGILLEGYSNLAPWAADGYLAGCITHAPGYIGMPYQEPELPDCELNTIVAWIHQGALNN
jgi:hypothetical protein